MGILDRFKKKGAETPHGPQAESITPGGSPIYRYQEPEEHGRRPPQTFGDCAKEINSRFEQLFPGREGFVFHEMASDLIHVDVNILRPTEDAPFYVMYTTGMSDLPMTLPDELADQEDLKYAELFLFLPGGWEFGKEGGQLNDIPQAYVWPVHMMRYFARFPHEYHTWLGWGHTIPNGPNYAPLCEGTEMGGLVLIQLEGIPPLEAENGRTINFYMPLPAYKEEIEYKLKYGMEELNRRFAEGRISLILDVSRPNLCADFTEVLDQ